MRAGATTQDLIAAVDLVAFVVLRQALTGLSDHGDERVRQFAAGAGGDLIAHQVAPSAGAIVAFLDRLEQGVSLLRLHLGRERRSRAMAAITASTATREVPESRLLMREVVEAVGKGIFSARSAPPCGCEAHGS